MACCTPQPKLRRRYFWSSGVDVGIRTLNPGFEEPYQGAGVGFTQTQESVVPGWETDDTSNTIEIWRNGFLGTTPRAGTQVAEINSVIRSRLWQQLVVPTKAACMITWRWSHAARNGTGVNRAQMLLGRTGTPHLSHDIVSDDSVTYAAGLAGWHDLTGTWKKPAGYDTLELSLVSVLPNSSVGNLVDEVSLVTYERIAVAESCPGDPPGVFTWRDALTGAVVPAEFITDQPA